MSLEPPLVSVLIPAYNSVRFIGECLLSVADQTYCNLEVIVVDDGSTDGTADMVSQFGGSITLHRLPANVGLAAALNVGLSLCKGRFIARMDADDIMYDWRIADQLRFMFSNPDVAIAGGGADYFGDHYGSFRSPASHREIVDALLVGNPFIHPTVMFRRDLIDAGDLRYDETAGTDEDYELWSRLVAKYPAQNQQVSSIRYRFHGGNNQFHPARRHVKKRVLRALLQQAQVEYDLDPDILVEFQMSGFVSREAYAVLRGYAHYARETGRPELGWLQKPLLASKSYSAFCRRTDRMRGTALV